ncbi:hypothetical protein A1OE_685 [Candidatus Endolissoclinum faulkneri L2]|uniref:Uncharacterized protein n=1 Tax=Candidatus Endolissoclinum faulkneri L2 TaxID=1193729 RepID=K7Z4D6_9PROT|nr:hypothetical protein A1OE_685 [Candidatus Endolissoclinum faulkneri L2]
MIKYSLVSKLSILKNAAYCPNRTVHQSINNTLSIIGAYNNMRSI